MKDNCGKSIREEMNFGIEPKTQQIRAAFSRGTISHPISYLLIVDYITFKR